MICPRCSARLVSGWAPGRDDIRIFSPIIIPVFPIVLGIRWTFPRLHCKDCRSAIPIRELESPYRGSARIRQAIGALLLLGVLSFFLWPVYAAYIR